MNMNVYLSEYIDEEVLAQLKERATVVSTFEHVENLDAMIVRRAKVTREILQKAARLKIIGKYGIGCDNIDLVAAKEYGVKVVNVPDGNVESVAELATGFIFDLCRNISIVNAGVRAGKYTSAAPEELKGTEVYGKTLGLVGVGHISQRIASIFQAAFHCKIMGYDPFCSPEIFSKLHIEPKSSLAELIRESDIVNVSVPLTKSTQNMISTKELDCFKKDALLICTSHGGVIDEAALYEALVQKKLAGAAIDVFLQDPPSQDNPLLTLENLIAAPHIGANTAESLKRVGYATLENIFNCLAGREVQNQVV